MDLQEYLEELANPSLKVKASGLARLSELSPEQARAVAAVWPRLDVRRRRRLIRELAGLVEDNVELNFDAVFLTGLEDEDAEVRLEAVRGLWEYEGPELIDRLLGIMTKDENPAVRAEAVLGLGRFVLLAELGKLRERHFQQVEEGLRRVWEDRAEIEEVRSRALEAMGPHNSVWVRQAIREAYESGIRGLKVSAVHAMGRSCQGRWLPLVLRELSSEDPELRYEAVLACGSLADERAVTHIAPLLQDTDREVQEAAISALGQIGGPAAKELLQSLADDPSLGLRQAAIEALGEMEFYDDPLSFKHTV